MSRPTAKITQFGDLVKFFQTLASHQSKTRGRTDEQIVNIEDDIPVSLQPVFRNLASLVDLPNATTDGANGNSQRRGARARRNTVASTTSVGSSNPPKTVEKFPAGQHFPFTFKMMLHKLYELEEWGKKIKDVLENSQKQFKSLNESNDGVNDAEQKAGNGASSFSTAAAPGKQKKVVSTQRGRSRSVAGVQQCPIAPTVAPTNSVRAVKKRCVGRRKSMTAIKEGTNVESSGLGGWVYDSAIASVDADGKNSTGRRRRGGSVGVEEKGGALQALTNRPTRKPRGSVLKVFNPNGGDSSITKTR